MLETVAMRTSPPVRIQVRAPYRPSTETEIKFDTYRYYLQCICEYLQQKYGTWQDFGLQSISRTRKLRGMGLFDKTWIERFVKIAWNAEYLFCMGLAEKYRSVNPVAWAPELQGCASPGYAARGEVQLENK